MLISTLWRSVSDEMFSGTVKSVRVLECALEDVCFREVPLRLRVTYKDYRVSFEKLLEMDNSVSVHYKYLRYLSFTLDKMLNASLKL